MGYGLAGGREDFADFLEEVVGAERFLQEGDRFAGGHAVQQVAILIAGHKEHAHIGAQCPGRMARS